MFFHFAENLEVLAGRRARNPPDFDLATVGLLHQVEPVLVDIEGRQPGRKRALICGMASLPCDLVELVAAEFVLRGNTL